MIDFPTPRKITAKLVRKENLNKKVAMIELGGIDNFEFLPGQFISLKVSDKNFRSYSIASSASERDSIKLIVSIGHRGLGSDFINNAQVGDQMEFVGPSGRFVLPEQLSDKLIFVATGTGLAPILSMLFKLKEDGYKGRVELLFGVRDHSESFYEKVLSDLFTSLQNSDYKICFSQESGVDGSHFEIGRVTSFLTIDKNAQYYICGNPFMVQDVSQTLLSQEVPSQNIYHEKFTVSVPKPAN